MKDKFIGRSSEIKQLDEYFALNHSCFVAIKGRRRIGKSRLVEEFASDKEFYKFVGIAPEANVTDQTQRDDFARRLKKYFGDLPSLKADEWSELFDLLAERTKKGKVIILFDEISWMAQGDDAFLGKLKNAWDEGFKTNPNLMLIVCGSVSSWVDKNLLSSTGFVGRIHFVMNLKELPLSDCVKFWGSRQDQVSAFDQYKYLSVTGGVPLYLESLDAANTVDNNIKRLAFRSGGLLFREFDNIFHDLFDRRSSTYKEIVTSLVNGPLDMESICRVMNVTSSGVMTEYLSDLIEAGFIARDYTWSFKTGKRGKLSRYRLSDNYVRFYLRYVEPNKEKIEDEIYEEKSLSQLPSWSSIMGLSLENLVINNRVAIWEALGFKSSDIVNDGPYFQRATSTKEGCQVDYLVQTQYNNLFVCEVKMSRHEIKPAVIAEMKQKLAALSIPRNFSVFPVLITVSEVSDAVWDEGYFAKIIQLQSLLK